MDARSLRAGRFFVVLLLVLQLSGMPAIGESARAVVAAPVPAPKVRVQAAGVPRVATPTRPVLGRPGLGSPGHAAVAPITHGTRTGGVTPRLRPNAQGPGTYAGTGSLDFSPVSQYAGYSTSGSGTVTPAAGYAYAVDFGDGSATSAIALGGNASTTFSLAHAYATSGTYNATVKATNAATGTSTIVVQQNVVIAALSGNISEPSPLAGTVATITFMGAVPASNPPPAPGITISFGDNATAAGTYGANVNFQHTYAIVGTYAITVTATATGATIASGSVNVSQTGRQQNISGTIAANPTAVYQGGSITFSGTAPVTPQGGANSIAFGDGTNSGTFGSLATYSYAHTFSNAGSFTAMIVQNVAGANANFASTPVTVAPLMGSLSTATVAPGTASQIQFSADVPATNAPAPPTVTLAFGDGATTTFPYGSTTTAHTYAGAGTYLVTTTANGRTIARGQAVVGAPTATISANPTSLYSGSSSAVAFTYTVGPRIAATQCVIDFDDGTSQAFTCATMTFNHTFTATTPTTRTVSVSPQGNASNRITVPITVDPLSGTFSSNPVTVGSASAITFDGVVPSNPPAAPPQVTIAFGDGTTTTVTYGTAMVQHTYATANTYDLTATVGNTTIATGTTVVNPARVVNNGTIAANPMNVYVGSSVTISGMAPAFFTGNTYFIAYGDGARSAALTGGQPYSVTHTYTAAGNDTATLELTQQGNGQTSAIATAPVNVAPLSGTFTAPTTMLGNTSSVTFNGTVPTANAPPPPAVTIAFGDGQTTTVTYGTATVQHMYTSMGTFALTATVNGTTIATGSAVVTAATIGLSASPTTAYSGRATTFTVSYPANVGATAQCTLAFGDGTAQTFACAPLTVTHTYTVATNTTETATVSLTGQPPAATTNVNVVVPAASMALSAPTIFTGSTENVTITTDAIAGAVGPALTLDFGDGSAPVTNLPFQNQVVSHGYARTRSLGSNHRFAIPGKYTLRLSDAAGTLATVTVAVVTPTATVTVANPDLVPGASETVNLAVGDLGGLAGPTLTVDFGDGSAIMATYANAVLQHVYAAAGRYTITVSDGSGALATQAIQVFQPSATISLNPSPVLLGSATTISVNVTPIGTAVGPAPLKLSFGDGTTTTLPSYTSATYSHTYPAIGTYTATLNAPGFGTIGSNIVNVVRQNQALLVPPAPVAANAPADIVVNVTPPAGFGVTPLRLVFGDGQSIIVTATGTYPHVYAAPGIYTVTLINTSTGLTISTQQITIEGVTPRVPIGQIYSQSFTNSPVLAGGETNILIQWSAAVPSLGTILDPIEGYVDLLDAKGRLIRRSDPFEIPGQGYAGPGIHTTQIPYDTPVDAHGTYQTRVILFSTQGGTITVGPPATLIIIGGPDPTIKANVNFHDTGALEIGPHAGQPGATFDPGMSLGFLSPTYSGTVSGIFDPISRRSDPLVTIKSGAQTQISGPDASPAPAPPAIVPSAAAGAPTGTPVNGNPGVRFTPPPYVPVTHNEAPGTTVASTPANTAVPGTPPNANYVPGGTPAPAASPTSAPVNGVPVPAPTADPRAFAIPDRAAAYATPSVPVAGPVAATSAPAPATSANPVPHEYTQLGGRGQFTLPDALGGGSTLRGLDLADTLGPTTYQVGYGYTALATASTSAQRGAVGDLTRAFGTDGSVRVTYFGRQDDPFRYPLAAGQTGPLVTDSELLALSVPTFDGFKLSASGALSSAHALQAQDYYRTDDAADKFGLTYTHDSYTAALDYHNAGPLFAVGSGPGATSDRVGFSSAVAAPLGKAVQVALNYTKDEARSAFSRQSDAGATFSFTLPASSTLSIGAKRDTQIAPTANTRNDSGTAALGTHIGIGTLALNAAVSSAQDLISSVNDAVTRTASIQYALQTNGHSLGIGINATMVSAQGAAPVPVMTATPDPTIGDPTAVAAPGGVGSSMVSPVSGPGGNAQIGETLTYGFPFGGRVINGAIVHGLELQFSASNSASHAAGTGGYDEALSGILSYHLSAHLAVGLRTEENWHGDVLESNRHKSSAIRLRLDLTQ